MKAHLTERSVKGLKPGPKNIIVYDAEVVGFGVRITSGGTRAVSLGSQRNLLTGWVSPPKSQRVARTLILASLWRAKKKQPRMIDPRPSFKSLYYLVNLVAGARFELTTFRL
jgi:hypothetical protein